MLVKKVIAGSALIILSVFIASSSVAEIDAPRRTRIEVGPLQVVPSLAVTETYSDNIYQSYDGTDKESDMITTLTPGITVRLPLRRNAVEVGYTGDFHWYADNAESDYMDHTLSALLDLDFPGGLTVGISDTFKNAVRPREWKEQAGLSGAADPYRERDYQSNDVRATAVYRFVDRWAAEARYGNYFIDYDEPYDSDNDYDTNLVGGSLYYRLTAKTDVLVDYNYAVVDYDIADIYDNTNHSAYAGLSFDPTAKLRGYCKAGWARKEYDNTVPGRADDASIFSLLVETGYVVSPYNLITLTAERVFQEDVNTNAMYTVTDAGLSWKHVFARNERVAMTTGIGYGTRDYDEPDIDTDGLTKVRDDEQWRISLGIDYEFRDWLSLAVGYDYISNDSNFTRYDYDENRVFFTITGTL